MRVRGAVSVALACALALVGASAPGAGRTDPGTSQAVTNARAGKVVATDMAQVERMCALLTSCDGIAIPPALFPQDFAACVTRMAADLASPAAVSMSLAIRECALTASSCGELRTCALRGASDDACAGRGKRAVTGVCDVDGRALTCWHDRVFAVRDCPRGGESCRVVDGDATCSLGSCVDEGAGAEAPHCSASGTHLVRCEKGTLASVNCAAVGLECAASATGAAACATGGPPCTGVSTRCEGGVATGCYDGRSVRVDCAAAGFACGAAPGDTALGACSLGPVPDSGCDRSARTRCEGGGIQYCAFGRPRSFSCKAAGFAGCDGGKPGTTSEVRCVP
jgi:hypothetical protein